MKKYKQGFYKPKNPKKYKGNINNIIFRSGLEKKYFEYFDSSDDVLEWSSEEYVVTYVKPTDNRIHKYYIDAWIKIRDKEGKIKEYLVEIKPLKETKKPRKKKNLKSYSYEVMTYLVNQAKWEATRKICEKANRDIEFIILTEKDI